MYAYRSTAMDRRQRERVRRANVSQTFLPRKGMPLPYDGKAWNAHVWEGHPLAGALFSVFGFQKALHVDV